MPALKIAVAVAWIAFGVYWLVSATAAKKGTRHWQGVRVRVVLAAAVVLLVRFVGEGRTRADHLRPVSVRTHLAAVTSLLSLALFAAGCGGTAAVTVVQRAHSPKVAGEPPVERSPEPADEPTQSEAPNTSPAITKAWPRRWCEVKIGDPRKEVTEIMRSYPTQEDSSKIPLIPHIHLDARGEDKVVHPPQPAGSDTWAAPLIGEFTAFYDDSLRVQQLDFDGQPSKLACPLIRT